MEMKVTNLMDAFKALEDVDIDDSAVLQALKESRLFDVRSPQDMLEADEFRKPTKKEVELEVIDPDADSIKHIKDNEEYVGQLILQCAVCKSKIFLDADKLVPSESDEDLYNPEIECPHCHKEGRGYVLIGQVGKVEEEPVITNDSLTDDEDIKFEKEAEEEIAEPTVEAPEEEEVAEEEVTADEESSGMETKYADDTEEVETGELGDEYDEVIEYDDTEEKPAEEEKEEVDSDEELVAVEDEEEEKKKAKAESLTEDIDIENMTIGSFFNKFVVPENIKSITIWQVSDGDEKQVFAGTFEELPEDFKATELKSFNVDGGKLVINTDITADAIEGDTVGDLLRWFDDQFDVDISIEDAEQGELLSGTRDSIIDVYEELPCVFLNAPERLNLYCEDVTVHEDLRSAKSELDLANPEDKLISDLFEACNFKENRIAFEGTPEYWLAESIREKEDLDTIYENYVVKCEKNIINEFKEVTGYTDKLDEALLAEKEAASTPVDMEEAIAAAKEALKNSNAFAVIYGYQKNGKFYGFKDPVICQDKSNYADKVEIVDLRYRPTGSICTLFQRALEESITVNSRKELTKLIEDCRNNKQPYSIKSLGNSRYTLLRESPEPVEVAPEETEVVDHAPNEVEVAETSTAVVDPRDQELVDKLLRVANSTADAIRRHYGVEVDERLVLADLIQDLRLVSGSLKPEDLANTPINQLTKQMYDAYNGFYDQLDQMLLAMGGRNERTSPAQKLTQAIEMIDGPEFSDEAIDQKVASTRFLTAMRTAALPGVRYPADPSSIRLLEGDVGDVQVDEVGEGEFNQEAFQDFINNYLDDTLEDTVIFKLEESAEQEDKSIVVEGKLDLGDDIDNIVFILKPELNEGLKKEYSVTNSLTEKVLTYKVN